MSIPAPPARSPRPGRTDAGVNQSAFVALLVAVILVIAAAIIVSGPRVGGAVASYFACVLQGDTDCGTPPRIEPPLTDETESLVVTAGAPGVDPDVLADALDNRTPGLTVSEQVFQVMSSFPLEGIEQPDVYRWPHWDAEVTVTPDGEISLELPADEVQTKLWGWVVAVVAGIVGYATGYLAQALCASSLGPEAITVPCGIIQAYVTAFVAALVAQLLNGASLADPKVWATAFAAGIVAGTSKAIWEKFLKGWVEESGPETLRKVSDAITGMADKVWTSTRDGVLAAGRFVRDLAAEIPDAFRRATAAAGWT